MCCAGSVGRFDVSPDERPTLVELVGHGSVAEMSDIMDSNRHGIAGMHLRMLEKIT